MAQALGTIEICSSNFWINLGQIGIATLNIA
jgi:hypothetical protein